MIASTKYIQPIAAESSLFAIWVRFRELQDKRRKGIIAFKESLLTLILHEFLWRDREGGLATWQPQGVGPPYPNGTSQGELVLSLSKEHSRTPGFRLVVPTARREGGPYYSRSLRSAQSRTAGGICDKRVPSFVIAVTPGREFMKYPSYEQLTFRQCNSASLLEKGKSDVFLCLHG